jgi:enoyl-CoA hydratase/carnithine racemase
MKRALDVSIGDGIGTFTLERPARRNALSRQLLESLRAALTRVTAERLGALVLTGAGDCFSAGADISELRGTAEDVAFDDALAEIIGLIREAPFVVIAAIEGACIGAALDLACACDLRVVAASALFELPSVRLGLLYNPAAILRLQRRLPAPTMRRLVLLGDRINGSEALASGIGSYACAAGHAAALASELARRAIVGSRALVESKRLLNALEHGDTDLAVWDEIRNELLSSPERRAALAAAKTRLHVQETSGG